MGLGGAFLCDYFNKVIIVLYIIFKGFVRRVLLCLPVVAATLWDYVANLVC